MTPNYGSEQWQTDPFNLAPAANAKPFDNGRGNGQQTSHTEQTYTLPGGTTTITEWSESNNTNTLIMSTHSEYNISYVSNPTHENVNMSSNTENQMNQINDDLNAVKIQMTRNIEGILQRGENIDIVAERSNKLSDDTQIFSRSARDIKTKMWWQNIKMWILIVVIICLIIIGIVLIAVLLNKKDN
ncbi:hypothetical protein I4U23_010973 [Adineta vaga]|nr:hypothetical protein I4U23_010973 [Adineta vaga]